MRSSCCSSSPLDGVLRQIASWSSAISTPTQSPSSSIEATRSNSVATRIAAALLSAASSSIWSATIWLTTQYTRVLAIPSKNCLQQPATYLEADDVRAIIAKPDRRTDDGWRDYTLLLFFYNCGARVSEATGIQWSDLQLVPPRQVRLRGKGRKERLLPLWRETAGALHRLRSMARERRSAIYREPAPPATHSGRRRLHPTKYASAVAAEERPVLAHKRITPHVLRHSCAVALLQSGTDVTVIRDYLGHASITTTGRYITTNLQMKRDALEMFWEHAGIEPAEAKAWKPQPDLLAFLQSL